MPKTKRSAEKEAFWRMVLAEHQASGLTVRAFCQQKGIAEPSFYAWRKEINKRDVQRDASAAEPPTLIPVDVIDALGNGLPHSKEVSPAPLVEIVTPSGFTLRLHRHLDPSQLGALLNAISRCPIGVTVC